jgi:hypothetical protein
MKQRVFADGASERSHQTQNHADLLFVTTDPIDLDRLCCLPDAHERDAAGEREPIA